MVLPFQFRPKSLKSSCLHHQYSLRILFEMALQDVQAQEQVLTLHQSPLDKTSDFHSQFVRVEHSNCTCEMRVIVFMCST